MNNYIKFTDAVDFLPVESISDEVKDFYAQTAPGSPTTPLKIRIAATHAGKVTRNNGFYLPHKMREGVSTWTSQYNKPVQVHHDEKTDPIGRVIGAAYIDISNNVRDEFKTGTTIRDSFGGKSLSQIYDAFLKGTLSRNELVDFTRAYFIKDSRINDPDYEGLGYIELVASITDSVAIQKILDGRYLTGSVGAATNQAICSNCKQDWAESGPCEHKPGKVYDEVKCVLIAGDLFYDEWSVVNKPADRHSKIIEVNVNGVRDFVELDEQEPGTVKDSVPEISLIDQEGHMAETVETTAEPVAEPTPVTAPTGTVVKDEMQEIKDFFGEDYAEIVDGEWGPEYAKMMFGLIEDATDETREAVTKEVKDAVLKAAARNKLSSKTFCGPGRSYPVNDCTHAKAAVRMAPHAGSGASAIAACARRKAARMGCPIGETKDAVTGVGEFTVDYFDAFSDVEIQEMRNGLDKTLSERGLGCATCEELGDSARVAELEKLIDEIKKNKDTDLLDLTTTNQALADAVAELRTAQITQIVDFRLLKGEKITLETVSTELKDKTGPEIREMLKEVSQKVDMQKIADTLNSGLGNLKPEGIVEDPTVGTQDAVQAPAASVVAHNEEMVKKVKLEWLKLRQKKGPEVADKFLDDCKIKGLIPSELSVKG